MTIQEVTHRGLSGEHLDVIRDMIVLALDATDGRVVAAAALREARDALHEALDVLQRGEIQ